MDMKKVKSKCKTILIHRCSEQANESSSSKENQLYHFDLGLNAHIKNFIDTQKNKLKSLDKKTAKKIVGVAESNLLKFLKSRAKVYCLRTQQTTHPFHLSQFDKQVRKSDLFDKNRLYAQLAREQKHRKVNTLEFAPLFEACIRETASTLWNRKSESSNKMEVVKKQNNYLPLSAHHKLHKLFCY